MATLFRNAVIDAMPQAVKSRLEDVVGLLHTYILKNKVIIKRKKK